MRRVGIEALRKRDAAGATGVRGVGVANHALQVAAHVGGVLVAKIAILLEGLGDDAFEFGWQIGIEAGGRWEGAIEDRVEDEARGIAAEGQRAGSHFVEHGAEGKEVGARIEFLAANLLWGHVGDGTERAAGAGELVLVESAGIAVTAGILAAG